MSEVKASIVIPTLNSAETFDKCLASIKANNSQYDYEIIVIDGGSKERLVNMYQKFLTGE